MTKLLTIATALLFLASVASAADTQDVEEYENRVNKVNQAAEKAGRINIALQRISTETGVPIENVRNQHKRHPEIGVAGLLIANVLANETKKAPAIFLKQRADGKKWLVVARENKVTVDKLNERLQRLERALTGEEK